MAKLYEYSINNNYKWYAVYTRGNYEKAVEDDLSGQDIEVFLPKRKVLRTWSDKKKWIEKPLFRFYVFIRVSNREYYRVLQHPSVLFFVCFNGETEFINMGYHFLNANKIIEAIEVFKMSVKLFPDSSNTWDSLGEAHIRKGDKAQAIKNYEKSLELNPNNDNAKKMLEQLQKK